MKKTFLTTLTATLLALTSAAAAPTDFGQGTQIGVVAGQPALPNDLRPLYRQFRREARYFAAMAVNYETGHGYFIQNFHDAVRVRAAAIEGCRIVSQSNACALYAVAGPDSLPISDTTASGLSMVAARDFNTRYRDHRKPGTYAAFAMSGASHHGFGNAYASQADARDTAISYCNKYVAKDMAELGPQARKYARARGWNVCNVVDVEFTPAD